MPPLPDMVPSTPSSRFSSGNAAVLEMPRRPLSKMGKRLLDLALLQPARPNLLQVDEPGAGAASPRHCAASTGRAPAVEQESTFAIRDLGVNNV